MTQDQIMALIRQVIPIIGGLLTALGWMSPETVAKLAGLATQIGGPIVIVAGAIWAFIANSKTSIIASASAMPEVKEIVVADASLAEAAKSADPATVVKPV